MKFKPIWFFYQWFLTRARQWRCGSGARGGGHGAPYCCDHDPSENCQCCRNLLGEASEKVIRKSEKVIRKQLKCYYQKRGRFKMLWSGKCFGPTWVFSAPPDQKSWLRLWLALAWRFTRWARIIIMRLISSWVFVGNTFWANTSEVY
jgi:hypothetical protein